MSSFLGQFNFQIIRDGQVAAQDVSALPPLSSRRKWVFLHGLMGYGMNWRRIAVGLGTGHEVLLLDQRGHGKSWKPTHGYAPSDFAEDLHQILDELAWDKVILVGHSMGGRNAVAFAARWPERVEKLVIEDIGPDRRPEAVDYFQALFDAIPTPFPSKLRVKEYFMNEFAGSKFGARFGTSKTLGLYLQSNLKDMPDGSMDWRFSKDAIMKIVVQGRASDQWDDFRRLNVPTLLVRGENSEDLSREVYDRVLVANPHLRGVEIPNAGHWVHYDQPEAFLRELQNFV